MRNRGRIDILCFSVFSFITVAVATSPLVPRDSRSPLTKSLPFISRGGASATPDIFSDSESEYDDDVVVLDDDSEDESEMESEDEEEDDAPLASSLKKKTSRATLAAALEAQTVKKSKKTVNASLLKSQPPKRKKSGGLVKKIPYIIRACMNPFTVFAMTKAYFASLFDIAYLEKDESQNLRSALEEKAKRDFAKGGGKKGKRAMKPGQAKTLSDLPQLSA